MQEVFTLSDFLYKMKDINLEDIRFFGHCCANSNKTNSQNYQDIWALYENDFKKNGYFVEFGATDGVEGSNTILLEQGYGWSGLVCEPNPVWHEALASNRFCDIDERCVYKTTGDTVDFASVTDSQVLSTIEDYVDISDGHLDARKKHDSIKVETVSLFDLLEYHDSPSSIDYMSVDTEGSEYDILKAFFDNPLSTKYNIKCMSIEHNYNKDMRDRLVLLMSSNGYERVFTDYSRWDDFWRKI